jgi:soluble lytic murein transglycosylase-like protein
MVGLAMCLCVFASSISAETIYFYKDKKGVLHFTDMPTSKKYTPYMLFDKYSKVTREKIIKLVRKYSQIYGVDVHLALAVLEVESNYDPQAESKVGAQGLMQIMPQTQKDLGLKSPFDPEANIEAGIRYLKNMLSRFSSIDCALAAYNAGPKTVNTYNGVPPYPETKQYIDRVRGVYTQLKRRHDSIVVEHSQ